MRIEEGIESEWMFVKTYEEMNKSRRIDLFISQAHSFGDVSFKSNPVFTSCYLVTQENKNKKWM